MRFVTWLWRFLEPWEWASAILFIAAVAATVLAMIEVTSSTPTTESPVEVLKAKWAVGVGLLIFGMLCASIGGLRMASRMPGTPEQSPWLMALSPVLGVTLFLFWVRWTTNPPVGWLASDPRRLPSHMLATILFAGFFGGVFAIAGPMALLGQILRRRNQDDSKPSGEADPESAG